MKALKYAVLLATFPLASFAADSSGLASSSAKSLNETSSQYSMGTNSGGGGVTVDINKRPALRDLVDSTTCEWAWARQFQKQYAPGSIPVLEKVKEAHWYLGDIYDREIGRIKVCMTHGPLKEIPVEDQDSVTIFSDETRQAAIRLNDMIFIDMNILNEMPSQQHRDFMFIHEVTHSFIPMKVSRRNESLRSFVKMLAEQEITAETLALNIETSHLDVPKNTKKLDSKRQDFAVAFNKELPATKRFHSVWALNPVKASLWKGDKDRLDKIDEMNSQVLSKINKAIDHHDIDALKGIYADGKMDYGFKFLVNGSYRDYNTFEPIYRAYETTGLTRAIFSYFRGDITNLNSDIVDFFLKEGGVPSLSALQALTIDFSEEGFGNTTRGMFTLTYFSGQQYRVTQAMSERIVEKVPVEILREYAKDPVVKECSRLMRVISDRLDD